MFIVNCNNVCVECDVFVRVCDCADIICFATRSPIWHHVYVNKAYVLAEVIPKLKPKGSNVVSRTGFSFEATVVECDDWTLN